MAKRRREEGSGSGMMWIIIGGVAGVVFLCVCLPVGGIIGLALLGRAAMTPPPPDPAFEASLDVGEFFFLINEGQTQEAYKLTSKQYQSKQSLKQFQQFVAKETRFKTYRFTAADSGFSDPNTSSLNFKVDLRAPDGKKNFTCTIVAVKENGEWKIDKFTIP